MYILNPIAPCVPSPASLALCYIYVCIHIYMFTYLYICIFIYITPPSPFVPSPVSLALRALRGYFPPASRLTPSDLSREDENDDSLK